MMSSNWESGPVRNQGTHPPSVLFTCKHMLRCRQTGRCEKAGGGKKLLHCGLDGLGTLCSPEVGTA